MAVVRVSTRGGSWVRDKMMDRRIRQEYARHATPAEAAAVMGFGKHKGVRVVEVEEAYLVWCAETLASCPAYIVRELERRGRMVAKDFAGESHLTANAQSKKTLRSEQKKSRLSEKSAKRRAARAARQSEASAEKLRAMRDLLVDDMREQNRLSKKPRVQTQIGNNTPGYNDGWQAPRKGA